MNIPNMISVFRILLIPVFLIIFHSNMENRILLAGLIFLLAGISDVLDGYIARRFNMGTKLGAALDPFADKLMSFAVLISFTIEGLIPNWILILILSKEFVMILGGLILYFREENIVIPSNISGKAATVGLYISILTIALRLPRDLITTLLIITVILNILAFIKYLKIFLDMKGINNAKS